eukprot:TRINITY_DN1125_c0_g1_i1.p1 TRINITY_DN1125_c0_g1~~TRINITY_DN1125_c0_g1_i1.p1  ORF type:complete len:436 (+),score=63.72 TRINITY_DN1125_c0_g1_i1:32-1309(+)
MSESTSPFITALVGGLGGFVFGYDTGIISTASDPLQIEFGVDPHDTVTTGFITSTCLFGAMFGSLFGGFLSQLMGMRLTAFLAASLCLFGAITSAFSVQLWVFMALRVILGIGVGLIGVICPLYVSTVAPDNLKGRFGVLFQLTLTFGILVSNVAGFAFDKVNNPFLSWRLMLATGGGLSAFLLQCVVFFKMIEPPKHYQFDSVSSETRPLSSDNQKPSFFMLFYPFARLKDTFTGFMLAVTLQLTGINAIMYFGPKILKSAGLDNAVALNIGIGGWNFITTFLAVLLVNRLSRRTLVVGGTLVMSLALVLCGIFMDSHIITNPTYKGIGVGIGLLLFLAGFEAGIGCLFWVLVNEIFEKDVKEYGASMTNVLQWGFNLLLSTFYPSLTSLVGDNVTFYVFGGIGVVCTIYLVIVLKEEENDHYD